MTNFWLSSFFLRASLWYVVDYKRCKNESIPKVVVYWWWCKCFDALFIHGTYASSFHKLERSTF